MMQPPRQPPAREQFAAQLLTLVLTDRPAIGGVGHSSYESYVYFYQQRHFWFHVMLSYLITFSVQNHTISARIYLPI